MAQETFSIAKRNYSVSLGVVEFDLGYPAITHYRRNIVAHFTEETTITRGLTAPSVDSSSITMGTYDFWYGGAVSGYTHFYFDYEASRVVSECHRSNEAGFWEKRTTTTTCTKVEAQ